MKPYEKCPGCKKWCYICYIAMKPRPGKQLTLFNIQKPKKMKTIILKKGFIGRDEQDGELNIKDSNKLPIDFVGSANHINPPVEIFYGSKAVAIEDFTVKTYFESAGNRVREWTILQDENGKYISNTYKKGQDIILAH